jgi:hypothetical protein
MDNSEKFIWFRSFSVKEDNNYTRGSDNRPVWEFSKFEYFKATKN